MIDPKMPPVEEPESNDQAQGPESENDEEASGVMHGIAWILLAPNIFLKELLHGFGFYLAIFLVALSLGQYLPKAIELISFPHELRYGEAVVVDQVRRVSEDPGLYPPIGAEPWLFDQYAPGYPVLVSLFQPVFDSPYEAGRWISLLFTILAAIFLALWVKSTGDISLDRSKKIAEEKRGKYLPRTAALMAIAGVFSLLEFIQFGYLMRIDAMALGLTVAGAWLTLGVAPRWRWLGAACFFLAVYTRQTMLAIILLTYAELYLREGKVAIRWGFGLLFVGLLFFAGLNLFTDGGFYRHAVASNLFPMNWEYGIKKYLGSFPQWKTPVFLAMYMALFLHLRAVPRYRAMAWTLLTGMISLTLPVFWSSFSSGTITEDDLGFLLGAHGVLVFTSLALVILRPSTAGAFDGVRSLAILGFTLLIARDGSDLNYLFEPTLLMLLIPLQYILRQEGERDWFKGTILSLVILQVLVGVYRSGKITEFNPERLEEMAERTRVTKRLEEFEGPILSEEPWVLVESGRPLVIEPYTARQMYESDVWVANDLRKAIEEGKYPAVIRSKQRVYAGIDPNTGRPYFGPWTYNSVRSFPRKIQDILDRHYVALERSEFVEKITDYYLEGRQIWVPRR